ncbi:MAG: FAD-dependent monooxygenase [Pseudonocardia sediminis]
MRVAVVGAGPGGLFLATLLRRADPSSQVTVFERNRADDTFGFGVVFSDAALAGLYDADPVVREALEGHGRHWDVIEVRLKGERVRCGGNGMAAISRHTLLALMQERARSVGADLRFSTEAGLDDLGGYDLVVAADGAGSAVREQLLSAGTDLGTAVTAASAKFIWFGAEYLFDGLTFVHERSEHGVFAVHGYPIADGLSTFIVETDEASWRRAGLDSFDATAPPGTSDAASQKYLQELFADQIDGRALRANNSRWGSFRTRRTATWYALRDGRPPVALLGDAVHTAHFSVGSGTKMAMEDAVALAAALTAHPGDVPAALAAYQDAAEPPVRRVQDAARPSLAWWEHFGRYHDEFAPWRFGYHFLTRSITDSRLARRAPDFVDAAHTAWTGEHGAEPLDTPFEHRGWSAPGRLVEIGSDEDGLPGAVRSPALALSDTPVDGVWAARLEAPSTEDGLPDAYRALAGLAAGGPVLVAVHGGTSLTRTLLCERARMVERVPALLVEPGADHDRAVTTVLSGRADLVGRPALP